ncbi:Protein EXORDIUM-like 1 [Linum perenne]
MSCFLLHLFILCSLLHFGSSAPKKLNAQPTDAYASCQYNNDPFLTANISINLIWYVKFTPPQRAIICDFVASVSSSPYNTHDHQHPYVFTWWKLTHKYYHLLKSSSSKSSQILESYSLRNSLSSNQILKLASMGTQSNAINVVLT